MTTTVRVLVASVFAALVALLPAGQAQADYTRPEPVLTVVDNTDGRWTGVRAAVRAWGAMPWVRIRPASSCEGAPGYCVVLDAYDHGESGWMGLATPLSDRMAHVQFNTSASYAAKYGTDQPDLRRAIACHELAHVLGISHPVQHPDIPLPARRGCIANSDHAHTDPGPTPADRRLFRAWAQSPWSAASSMLRWEYDQGRIYAGHARNVG